MTLSPTLTSSGTRLPLSSTRPGPTARTSPSCGFSLAVSGMTRPEAVVCSASRVLTRIRSSSGLMLTDTVGRPPLPCVQFEGSGPPVGRPVTTCRPAAARRRGGRTSPGDRHSRWESANAEPSPGLALGQVECQPCGLVARVASGSAVASRWHDAAVDPDTFARLLSPSGLTLLARAVEVHAEAAGDPVRAADLLRRRSPGVDPALAAAAMTQAALRLRARAKFGADAERMWFTPDGLEQATRTEVARHRAARIWRWLEVGDALSPGAVLDAGCGIGGDLVALARTGAVVAGVDRDPLRVAVAEANLRALQLPGAVRVADARTLD